MNNGEYIRVATNYLPLDYPVCDVRIEYRNAAHIGDTLYIYTAQNEEYYYVVLCNKEMIPYAIAEYKKGSPE
jgi:acyl-ACP thioesterase